MTEFADVKLSERCHSAYFYPDEVTVKHPLSFSESNAQTTAFDYKEIQISVSELLFLCLFSVVGAALLPILSLLPASEMVRLTCAVAVIVLSIVAQTRMLGSFPSALGHTLTLLAIAFLFDNPLLAALLGALITSVSALSKLFLCKRTPWLFLLPLIAYGITLAVLRSPFSAALCLVSFPCGWVTAYLLQKEVSRVSSICRIALTLGVFAAAALAVGAIHAYGAFNFAVIRELIEEVRLGAISALTALLSEASGSLPSGADAASYAEQTVNTLMNYLPALPIILFCVFGWVLHTAVMRVAIAMGLPQKNAARMMSFDMSAISAVMYFFAFLLWRILVSEKTVLYGTAAGNLCLCLFPGMLITAWIAIQVLLLTRAPSCLSVILYLAVLLLTVLFPTLMLPLVAAFGATVILVGSIRRYLAEKKS